MYYPNKENSRQSLNKTETRNVNYLASVERSIVEALLEELTSIVGNNNDRKSDNFDDRVINKDEKRDNGLELKSLVKIVFQKKQKLILPPRLQSLRAS